MSDSNDPGQDQRSDEDVTVDAVLVSDLESVEHAVDVYLQSPSSERRGQLLRVLNRLDEQIGRSDAYENEVIGSGAVGYSTKGAVIGETSISSPAEEVRGTVFGAQTELVKAAKKEVTSGTPATLAQLREARAALAAARDR
jgi:hypothetical protein